MTPGASGDFNPGVARDLERIHGVYNHRSSDPQIVPGDGVGDLIARVDRKVGLVMLPQDLFDGIDGQVRGLDAAGKFPGSCGFAGSR